MLLVVTLFLPLAGALALAAVPRDQARFARLAGLAVSLAAFGCAVALAVRFQRGAPGFQLGVDATWVRTFGVHFKVGVDGVSLPLVLLTTFLTPLAIVGAWRQDDRPRNYVALLLAFETAMLGVLVALDLFVFYIFWEAVLVPSYFLIGSWGGERRVYAAVKFFLYSLLGGLLMLVAIIAMYQLQSRQGAGTFDYETLRRLGKSAADQRWLFLGFAAAFAVKTPLVPLHTWLPDAYVEAPTTTTVLLAGAMSKLGVYGFVRMAVPLFPDAARHFQPLMLTLAVIGILYCAVVAAVQKDFKRLVAYSSVSHLGFITLGVFALTIQGVQGAVFYAVAHGVVIGGLFFLAGMLQERRGSRRIDDFGGLQQAVPRMAGVMLVLTLAAVALPGLIGFVGEFLTLLGAFLAHRVYAVLAAVGVILGAVYLLWAYQRMFHGPLEREENRTLADLSPREWVVLAPLVAVIIVLGAFPRPLLRAVEPAANRVVQQSHTPAGQQPGTALNP